MAASGSAEQPVSPCNTKLSIAQRSGQPTSRASDPQGRRPCVFTGKAGRPRLAAGMGSVMLRVRLIAVSIVAVSVQLAGCTGSTSSLFQSSPPKQPLQFESVPPGADVSTADGQTCKTPCSLAVPLAAQAVNFAMNGYTPQTVPVQLHQDNVFSPSTFTPNPVTATLQAAAKPALKPKPRKTAAPPKVAAKPAPQAPPTSAQTPAPAPAPAPDSAFPPPPPTQQSPVESRFPTPSQLPAAR
jgi:hypothetical protein